MNVKKFSLSGFCIGVGILLIAIAWGIGGYYQKGIFLGPYLLSNREVPVYLEFPIPASIEKDNGNWDFDYKNQFFEIGDYHNVAVYDIDVVSLITEHPYPLGKSFPDPLSMKIKFSTSISIDEAQKVIDSQPKHPQYWQNRAQLVFYRIASIFASIIRFHPILMATAALLTLLWLWFCRSAMPFVVWWGIQAVYVLAYKGLYNFYLYAHCRDWGKFFFFLFNSPGHMYHPIYGVFYTPGCVCGVSFCIIGPILLLILGILFLTKHVIPKQKRLFEDFMKIDKDKDKKNDLNVTDVEFKTVSYNLREKIEKYRTRPELFLGVDDNGNDVSIPESLANQHLHVMGPTGCGKTATLMLPLAIQAIEKGYGACLVDFKGDYSLIQSIQEKCKQVGKKFYFFSIDPRERTDPYNPLSSGDYLNKVDRIICALKLDQAGPARYYADQQRVAFIEILKRLITQGEYVSFPQVLEFLRDPEFINRIGIKAEDVAGLVASLSKIADYPMINEDGIDLKKVMDEGSVVYFNLRSQINTDLAEAIGRMLTIDLKYHSAYRSEHDPKFFIFIDEFQTIASSYFVDIISKIRSANYCLVLANQSRGNLLNVSQAFHDAVMINSYTKIVFNQFEDAKFWANATGTIRVDEAMMRMESGEMFNEDKTVLDGKRVRDGVVSKVTKPLFSENIFLKLPKGKSVVFVKGRTACMTNHGFYHTEAEFKEILKRPFVYDGGKMFGDPLEYLVKQNKKAEEDRLNKQNISKTKQKEAGAENLESNKTETGKLKNEKQTKKGEKDENGKSKFRVGGDAGPVE